MNPLVLYGRSASTLSISATAAQTAPLEAGIYDVWATVETFIAVGRNASTGLTVANGYIVRANTIARVMLSTGDRIGAIAGGAGTLSFHQVGG